MEAQTQPTPSRTAIKRQATTATPSSRKRLAIERKPTQPVRPKSPRQRMQLAQPMRAARSAPHLLPPVGVGHSSRPRLMKILPAEVCALAPKFSQLPRPHLPPPVGAGRLGAGVGLPLNPVLPHGADPGARYQIAWDPALSSRGLRPASGQETHGPEATPPPGDDGAADQADEDMAADDAVVVEASPPKASSQCAGRARRACRRTRWCVIERRQGQPPPRSALSVGS